MNRFRRVKRSDSGAALILILGIVSLLSVMVIAFLGSSSKQVVASSQSHSIVQEQQLAELATSQFLADINNEILAGSVSPVSSGTLYYPATTLSSVPDRYPAARTTASGAAPSMPVVTPPNLLKQSAYDREFFDPNLGVDSMSGLDAQLAYPQAATYPPTKRASSVSSTQGSGRVSTARWNKALLLPRANPSSEDAFPDGYEPLTSGAIATQAGGVSDSKTWSWTSPDWVYVSVSAANPTNYSPALKTDPVVGRYAFQAYDIGGLLDLNVAGYSSDVVSSAQAAKKGSQGLADLTQLGFTDKQLKALVAFRNAATTSASTSGGPYDNNYLNFLLRTPDPKNSVKWASSNGFMRVGSLDTLTNRGFYSRQSLQSFLLGGLGGGSPTSSEKVAMMEALQSVTHFSRSLEQPSYKPGFYLADSSATRTRSNVASGGSVSSATSPVFIRPSIVPPKGKIDDILFPINVVTAVYTVLPSGLSNNTALAPHAASASTDYRKTAKQPYEMALGNNRGGNDSWGTIDERSFGSNPANIISSSIKPAQKGKATALQDVINPGFLEVRVNKAFTRLDGTKAVVGEPLVKKRFPLERLSWISSEGPSSNLSTSDSRYNSLGTAENIYNAFGLTWMKSGNDLDPEGARYFWYYDHGKTGDIYTLDELVDTVSTNTALPREPDFFELLLASINVGSIGKSAVASHSGGVPWDTATYQQLRDRNTRYQVLEVGANLIDQYDTDSYPTTIRLPNNYPNPDNSSATKFYPALFTARGVEDLPYFYRLQWRGIKNTSTSLMPSYDLESIGVNGVLEIPNFGTAPWDSNYSCGTTSLIAFPELWNPHAQLASYSGAAPTAFRVVAASQTPNDVVLTSNTLTFSSGLFKTNDRGFQNAPKIWDKSSSVSGAAQNRYYAWWSQYGSFTIRPVGQFRFASYNANHYDTALWSWFMGNTNSSVGGGIPEPNSGYSTFDTEGSIFWEKSLQAQAGIPNFTSLNLSNNTSSTPINTIVNAGSLFEYAMSGIPTGVTPASGADDFLGLVANGVTVGTFNVVSGTYTAATYNFLAPGLTLSNIVEPAAWYTLTGHGAPSATFPKFNSTHTRQISLIHADVVKATGSGASAARHGVEDPNTVSAALTSGHRWVDFRGTELTFTGGPSTGLFREPTPLCKVGMPSGSNLQAGPDNFFSGAPYNGSVQSSLGEWVGFSLGEVPSQYITACRIELSQAAVLDRDVDPVTFLPNPPAHNGAPFLDSSGNVIKKKVRAENATQVLQNGPTQTLVSPGTSDVVSLPVSGAVNNFPVSGYNKLPFGVGGNPYSYFRFFAVPINSVAIAGDHYLTLQVQCKDAQGNWITYDERYVVIRASGLTPVLNKQQWTSTPVGTAPPTTTPNNYTVSWVDPGNPGGISYTGTNYTGYYQNNGLNTQMSIGIPVVSSYDPRSSRFGHPGRAGTTQVYASYGTRSGGIGGSYRAADRYPLQITPSEPTGFPASGNTQTARPRGPFVESTSGPGTAQVLALSQNVPAAWGHWMWFPPSYTSINGVTLYTYNTDFDMSYGTLRNDSTYMASFYTNPTTPDERPPAPVWWAQGKWSGIDLCQKPSLNAYDYGWFSRAFAPKSGDNLDYSATRSTRISRGTATTDSLSNFRRDMVNRDNGATTQHILPAEGPGTLAWTWDNADSLRIGNFSENIQPKYKADDPTNPLYASVANPEFRQAYADCDDVVRRAMGAFAPVSGFTPSGSNPSDGLPEAQPSTVNKDNRPIVLNRPFRSVADMGYAFRGSPWKNLSFSTPETGDAALLDVFCLTEPPPVKAADGAVATGTAATSPLVAGKVNLNTRQEPVLRALFSGALKDELGATSVTAEATAAAKSLMGRTMGSKAWLGPLANVSEVAGKLFGKDLAADNFGLNDPVYTSTVYRTASEPSRNPDLNPANAQLNWHFTGFSADLDNVFTANKDKKNLRMREAVIRALVDSGQTRVWNIMLDLIVQTGRMPSAATDLKQFSKEGEHRVWVFLSIDRLTGEVLEKLVEDVAE